MRIIGTALATATVAGLVTVSPAQSADPQPPSRPTSFHFYRTDVANQRCMEWAEPARTGSTPVRKYVIRWHSGRLVVPATATRACVDPLAPGRYVFRIRAVSRSGAGPWALSRTTRIL